MTDLASSMKIIQLESDLKAALNQIGALRQHLALAICAVCSDALDGEEMALNGDEHLCHARCVDSEKGSD